MTQTKLDQLEALSKAATPGPWSLMSNHAIVSEANKSRRVVLLSSIDGVLMTTEKNGLLVDCDDETRDLDFIFAMRNNIDDIIAVARDAKEVSDEAAGCLFDMLWKEPKLARALEKLEQALEKLK